MPQEADCRPFGIFVSTFWMFIEYNYLLHLYKHAYAEFGVGVFCL